MYITPELLFSLLENMAVCHAFDGTDFIVGKVS